MAIGDSSRANSAVQSETRPKPVCVNVTLVRKDDDPDQKLIFWLTRVPTEACAEEARLLGYTFVSLLGSLDEVAGGSTNAKALSLMTFGNDLMVIMVETLLNATGGPMFSLGHQTGRQVGYTEGLEAGDAAGFERGKTVGIAEGDAAGYERGHHDGYITGVAEGKRQGVELIQRHLGFLFAADPAVLVATLEPEGRS